jgi:hypothetical protein
MVCVQLEVSTSNLLHGTALIDNPTRQRFFDHAFALH